MPTAEKQYHLGLEVALTVLLREGKIDDRSIELAAVTF